MPVSLSEDQRSELVRDYQSGMSYKELSKKYSIGSTTARSIVVKSGVETRVAYNSTTGRKCSPEKEQEIITAYQSGLSFQKVADLHEVSPDNVRLTLIRYDIPIRTWSEASAKRKLSFEDEDVICQKYRSGMTMAALGAEYSVDDTTILGVLRRKDEASRKTKENQYNLDEHFFDQIDTEEKAYFLGMLYADGNVARDQPSIKLSLQECDKYLVERLNSLVTSDRPIKMRTYDENPNHQRQFGLEMYSHHMKETLVSYGMVPAKSLILQFPNIIASANEDVQRHFIRGYFDGDGHVSLHIRKDKRNARSPINYKFLIAIVGTREMCNGMEQVINCYLPTVITHVRKHNKSDSNTYNLSIQGRYNVTDCLTWLYHNATIYMQRKKETANNIFKNKNGVV